MFTGLFFFFFFLNSGSRSQKIVSINHNFCREISAEADSNRGHAFQPSALSLGQTNSEPFVTFKDPPFGLNSYFELMKAYQQTMTE